MRDYPRAEFHAVSPDLPHIFQASKKACKISAFHFISGEAFHIVCEKQDKTTFNNNNLE